MKILSVYIGDTHILFDNNMWTGHESIFVNGELVSRKFSFWGVDHIFEVEENGEWVEYVLTTGVGFGGINANLIRNGIQIIWAGSGDMEFDFPLGGGRNYRVEELV